MSTTNHRLVRLRNISTLMDSRFEGPMGFRFGLDGIIGLIPVLGDFAGRAVSLYIIYEAAMIGCGPSVLLRMGLNVLVESLVEWIPILGNIFDFVWKANNKNMALIETHVLDPRGSTAQSRLVLILVFLTIIGLLIATISFTVYAIQLILQWVSLAMS